jgi:hypothetical protein
MRTPRTLATSVATIALLALSSAAPVSAQSAEPDAEAALPAGFTGRIVFGDQVRSGTVETVEGRTESRGSAHAPLIVAMTDPRLDGDVTISFDTDEYAGPDGSTSGVGSGTWRIENADGAWQGSYNIVWTDEYESVVTTTLTGEGAYAGMSAVWEQTLADSGWDLRGVIFPAAPPDPPTAP